MRGEQPIPEIVETIPCRQGAGGDWQAVPVTPGDGQLALDRISPPTAGRRPGVRRLPPSKFQKAPSAVTGNGSTSAACPSWQGMK